MLPTDIILFDKFMQNLCFIINQLRLLGQLTYIFKLPYLDNYIIPISASTKLSLPMIKYTLGLFITYIFSFILRLIPSKLNKLKHFLSFLIGSIYVQYIYEDEWIHSFITIISTYLLCMILPRQYIGQIVFIYAMTYVVLCQMYCLYTYYYNGRFDFTRTQMVCTIHISYCTM